MTFHIQLKDEINREEKYQQLIPQLRALVDGERDVIATMANISAAMKMTLDFFWIGFYIVNHEAEQLVLGPFQGTPACTRINKGKGLCGTAWEQKRVVLTDDVNTFPGHIACNALSKSEVVIPIFKGDRVLAVLDIDSDRLADFSETDVSYLEEIVQLIPF